MFLISILGAAVAPFVVVIATFIHEPATPFEDLFYNVNLYTVLIIGPLIWRGDNVSFQPRICGKYIEKFINDTCVTNEFYY